MRGRQRVRCFTCFLGAWAVPATALACAGLGLTVLLSPGQQLKADANSYWSLYFYNLPLDTNPMASMVSSDDPYSNFQVSVDGIPEPCGIMVTTLNSDSPACTSLLTGARSVSYGRCYSFDDLEVRPACEGEVVASRVVGYVGAVLVLGSLAAAMYVSWVQCCINGCRRRRSGPSNQRLIYGSHAIATEACTQNLSRPGGLA